VEGFHAAVIVSQLAHRQTNAETEGLVYMLEVFSLVTGAVFATILTVVLVIVISKLMVESVRDYARARRAIQRITPLIDINVVNIPRSE